MGQTAKGALKEMENEFKKGKRTGGVEMSFSFLTPSKCIVDIFTFFSNRFIKTMKFESPHQRLVVPLWKGNHPEDENTIG